MILTLREIDSMSKLDELKPSGHNNLYKVEIQVEGEWVAMMFLSKQSIIKVADVASELSDEDCEAELSIRETTK